MQLVIIAGGKGTRLGLEDIPKPMVKIGDKPLLEHQIELAKKYGQTYGIDEIFILSGHLSHVIEDYFGDGEKWGVKIHHIIEPYPLGTAGSVKLLEGLINDRFMVFYGDVVMDFDIDSFVEFDKKYSDIMPDSLQHDVIAQNEQPCDPETSSGRRDNLTKSFHQTIGTIIVHPNDHPKDSDLIEVDENNRVTKILPKPHKEGEYYQNLVNAAVYIFSPKIFDYIESGVSQDFGKHILQKIVESGETLMAYSTPEYIKDMGTLDRFDKVCDDFLSGKVERLNKKNPRPAIFLDRDGVICKDMDKMPFTKDFELLEKVSEAIKEINKSDYLSVVVTNQPMIAKGFVTFDEVYNTHKKMESLLGEKGAFVNKIYFCPHHPEKGFDGEVKELKIDCDCRKPKAGMLLKAQKELNIDLKNSWMIGDKETDMLAGKKVDCKTILIHNTVIESTKQKEQFSASADYICTNLYDAVQLIKGSKK